jgi:hypothetical protein
MGFVTALIKTFKYFVWRLCTQLTYYFLICTHSATAWRCHQLLNHYPEFRGRRKWDFIAGTIHSSGAVFFGGIRRSTNYKEGRPKRSVLNIVGSGSSLNRLTSKEEELLEAGDILTFNMSLLADVQPRYHIFQPGVNQLRPLKDFELAMQSQTDFSMQVVLADPHRFDNTTFISRYRSSPFLVNRKKGVSKDFERKYGRSLRSKELYLSAPFPASIQEICSQSKEIIQPTSLKKDDFILKFGSSLPFAILLGIKLGYQKICLFGCDLLDEYHFYDYEPFRGRYSLDENFPSWYHRHSGSFALTNLISTDLRGTSQIDDVASISEWLEREGIAEVRIINSDSRLSVILPIADSSWFQSN